MKAKRDAGYAFTLIEMLISAAVIGVLAAILLPVYAIVREKGRRTTCLSNLRQIDMALTMYAQDNSGLYPLQITGQSDWPERFSVMHQHESCFAARDAQVPPSFDLNIPNLPSESVAKGYAINGNLSDTSIFSNSAASERYVRFPSATVALAEASYGKESAGNIVYFSPTLAAPDTGPSSISGFTSVGPPGGLRHGGGSNYAFVDGHVRWYTPTQVLNSEKPNDGAKPSFAL